MWGRPGGSFKQARKVAAGVGGIRVWTPASAAKWHLHTGKRGGSKSVWAMSKCGGGQVACTDKQGAVGVWGCQSVNGAMCTLEQANKAAVAACGERKVWGRPGGTFFPWDTGKVGGSEQQQGQRRSPSTHNKKKSFDMKWINEHRLTRTYL